MYLFAPNEECLARASKEIGLTEERFRDDVRTIKKWMGYQHHLPQIPEDSLLCENMLLRCKGRLELAKQCIDFNFSMRTIFTEFFVDRDPLSDELQHIFGLWTHAPLKQLTPEGYRVQVYVCITPDALCSLQTSSLIKLWLMQLDLELKEDVNLGEIHIHDLSNMSMAHMVRTTPTLSHQLVKIWMNGIKIRLKAVHFLNPPPFMDALMKITKTLLPKKLVARIHIHSSLESLHRHVDRANLPEDYGGDLKPLADLSRDWRSKVESYRNWLMEYEHTAKVDEAKRPGGSTCQQQDHCFGFEGSFKKLQVD